MPAMSMASEPFGVLPDGTEIELHRLTSAAGVVVELITQGAAIHRILVPDGAGGAVDVTLGFDDLAGYTGPDNPHMGGTIGRFANRIAGASFELDGASFALVANEGANTLHGGPRGFDRRPWTAEHGAGAVTMRLSSPDGDLGFPGAMEVSATFALSESGALRIDYVATTDAPTVVNLTNHVYVNLAGGGTILDHVLEIGAGAYLPVDAAAIPTGDLAPVAGTPLDFTTPAPIGARIGDPFEQLALTEGYDHCYVLDAPAGEDGLMFAARATDPVSGRSLTVHTTEPAVQVYSGNHLSGVVHARRSGLCLETQHFPDSPHRPRFPSTVLRPGETFRSTTVYAIGAP